MFTLQCFIAHERDIHEPGMCTGHVNWASPPWPQRPVCLCLCDFLGPHDDIKNNLMKTRFMLISQCVLWGDHCWHLLCVVSFMVIVMICARGWSSLGNCDWLPSGRTVNLMLQYKYSPVFSFSLCRDVHMPSHRSPSLTHHLSPSSQTFTQPLTCFAHPVIIPTVTPPHPPPRRGLTPFSPLTQLCPRAWDQRLAMPLSPSAFSLPSSPSSLLSVQRGCLVPVRTSENSSNLNYTSSFITLLRCSAQAISP